MLNYNEYKYNFYYFKFPFLSILPLDLFCRNSFLNKNNYHFKISSLP